MARQGKLRPRPVTRPMLDMLERIGFYDTPSSPPTLARALNADVEEVRIAFTVLAQHGYVTLTGDGDTVAAQSTSLGAHVAREHVLNKVYR